ncbi:hypothetical protein, partial [Paraburkholderia sediminicola]|uniref:hypothetical protein n=1 Tax=Paraburkholderia sediminicola TaxID=458836 RepID=UPI0038BBD581
AAKVRSLSLENHLALATMRSGNGAVDQMSCLMKTVYLAYFLRDTLHADSDIDAFRLCEAALEVSAANAQVGRGWTLPDGTDAALATVLALFDRLLLLITAHEFDTAWKRLQRFLEGDARSPLPPATPR